MENSELVKIALTAIISVVAKEVLTWAFSAIIKWSVVTTAAAKLKSKINVFTVAIFDDIGSFLVGAWGLRLLLQGTTPVTRLLVFAICLWTVYCVGWLCWLVIDIHLYKIFKQRQAAQTAA